MNLLQEALIGLLSGLTTKNEDGSINWGNEKIHPLDIEKQTYMVECADGEKIWFLNGQLHREDGPAVEKANGTKYWYLNGKLHREDGPAIKLPNGTGYWFLNGVTY